MSAETATYPAARITGYVEALTETRVLGWAWAPGEPSRAVTAELLAGETVIASVTADVEREDLKRNGIGDGCHAFSLDVPESARGGGPLRVVARLDGMDAVPLTMPPSQRANAHATDGIERALAALGNSQRLLHRNLQAVMMELREQRAMLTDGTAAMEAPLSALDAAAMRIEERVAQQQLSAEAPAPRSRRLAWLFGIAALVLVCAASGAMLWRTLAAQ